MESWQEPWQPETAEEETLSLLDVARIGALLVVLFLSLGIYRGCVEDFEPAPAAGRAAP